MSVLRALVGASRLRRPPPRRRPRWSGWRSPRSPPPAHAGGGASQRMSGVRADALSVRLALEERAGVGCVGEVPRGRPGSRRSPSPPALVVRGAEGHPDAVGPPLVLLLQPRHDGAAVGLQGRLPLAALAEPHDRDVDRRVLALVGARMSRRVEPRRLRVAGPAHVAADDADAGADGPPLPTRSPTPWTAAAGPRSPRRGYRVVGDEAWPELGYMGGRWGGRNRPPLLGALLEAGLMRVGGSTGGGRRETRSLP